MYYGERWWKRIETAKLISRLPWLAHKHHHYYSVRYPFQLSNNRKCCQALWQANDIKANTILMKSKSLNKTMISMEVGTKLIFNSDYPAIRMICAAHKNTNPYKTIQNTKRKIQIQIQEGGIFNGDYPAIRWIYAGNKNKPSFLLWPMLEYNWAWCSYQICSSLSKVLWNLIRWSFIEILFTEV